MKTLLVYCAGDDTIKSLCRESAFKRQDAQAFEVSGFSGKSVFKRFFSLKKDRPELRPFVDMIVDFSPFDRVILACDEIAGEIPVAMAQFIKENNFRYKNIDCVIFGTGRFAKRAGDVLKMSVSLSGGTVRCSLRVSPKEIKKDEEDVLFSLRHRLAV